MDMINIILKRLQESRRLNEKENYSQYSRDELIELAQEGDQLALELLIDSHKDLINRMTKRYFLKSGDQDDLFQIATLGFWDAVKYWDMTGDFNAYAGMMIKQKLIDEIRKDNTGKNEFYRQAKSLDSTTTNTEGDDVVFGDTIPSKSGSAEDEFLGIESANNIREFLETKLSSTEREVIKKYISGYKVSQIAEELGMKYKSAENAIMRVRNKLSEFVRTRESKHILDKESIFTDEEKQLLSTLLDDIDESLNESVHTNELYNKLHTALQRIMTSSDFGYDEGGVDEYTTIRISEINEKRTKVEIGAEVSYEGLMKIADTLNPIIQKYDKDSYFDAEQPGILVAFLK